MNAEEILSAVAEQMLEMIEEVDPATAVNSLGYLNVSGRVAMPLSGVNWLWDRSSDPLISDEQGAALCTLCLVKERPPIRVSEMTGWQYTAYLADCELGNISADSHQFSKDYLIIEEADFERYTNSYMTGSALWGGFSHDDIVQQSQGWRTSAVARPGVIRPTPYHEMQHSAVSRAIGPRDQFLSLYHTIELLFDYVTFRKLVKSGNDLAGFGKVMSSHQRSELDRLRGIFREFCGNLDPIADRIMLLQPYIDRAEQMFQIHSKDGNPFAAEDRWDKFKVLCAQGSFDTAATKQHSLAGNDKVRDELVISAAAYFIYRLRSSIAHSRIGEYVLTPDDNDFVSKFGIPLLEEVALQIFSSNQMLSLSV